MSDKQQISLEQDMEQTRVRLASTIDQLFHRASPKTIVRREIAAIKGYFVDASGSPRQDHIIKVGGGVVGVLTLLVVVRKIVK